MRFTGFEPPLSPAEKILSAVWEHLPGGLRNQTRIVLGVLLIIIVLAPVWIPAWLLAVPLAWSEYPAIWHTDFGRGVAVAILVGIAAALYGIRTTARFVYGVAEIVVGAAACWFTLDAAEHGGATTALKLAAAVYIIVRGLDNAREGYDTRFDFWKSLMKHGKYGWRRYGKTIAA